MRKTTCAPLTTPQHLKPCLLCFLLRTFLSNWGSNAKLAKKVAWKKTSNSSIKETQADLQRNPWSQQADICEALHVAARCGSSTRHKTLSWEGFSLAKAARDLLSSGFGEAFKEINVKWRDWEAVCGVAKPSAFIRWPWGCQTTPSEVSFFKANLQESCYISHTKQAGFQVLLPNATPSPPCFKVCFQTRKTKETF